ncbi:hypothetical protein LSTR_LSTR013252 [Laodelphax striatellus]|uniref:Haloacid dehalogenase-like hydrolase domain-containing protein 2 n=1 Tax=Laodelphax striatellus TaxID=195883 RepID=A0A482WM36_LAOST|nr:hypothetical protein LSTR_LSTR013252 [Laodelphax striatellus]
MALKGLRSVLIDLSGTLHIDNEITPGAVDALKRLRETNVIIKFVTNTTKESKRFLYERLCKLGFDLKHDEILTSLLAARQVLQSESLRPMLLVDSAALEDFEGLTNFEGEPDSVVVGLAPEHFNYDKLNQAFRLLLEGAKLIAIHEGRYYKRADGLALGPGPFVKALEYAAGGPATVVGKPSAEFFHIGLSGVHPASAVMIGDDVNDDINGAQNIGMHGYLVQTGKYRPGDEDKISPKPFKTVPNFAAAVEDIIKQMNS